jgi:AcrR family transcriptional regulator
MSNTKKQLVPADNGGAEVAMKPRVRERILHTASRLFYQHGIRAVGVDAIASAAGTNKMSFYRNFASKDDLVMAYLLGEEQLSWRENSPAACDSVFGSLPYQRKAKSLSDFDAGIRREIRRRHGRR